MTMPKLAILFGILLNALGLGVFAATGMNQMTALIPCVFGVIILLCGIVSTLVPGIRMHLMHVAALFGVIGTLGGLSMSVPKVLSGSVERPVATYEQLAMGVLCFVFVVLCIKSFLAARRARLKS